MLRRSDEGPGGNEEVFYTAMMFSTTSITRECDGPDGYLYRIETTLDFHQGWYTRLSRTKRQESGWPMWSHALITETVRATGRFTPNCTAQPIMKFETADIAKEWLEEFLNGGANNAKAAS